MMQNPKNVDVNVHIQGVFLLVSQSFCVLGLKETDLPNNTINIYYGKRVSLNSNMQKLLLETSKKKNTPE